MIASTSGSSPEQTAVPSRFAETDSLSHDAECAAAAAATKPAEQPEKYSSSSLGLSTDSRDAADPEILDSKIVNVEVGGAHVVDVKLPKAREAFTRSTERAVSRGRPLRAPGVQTTEGKADLAPSGSQVTATSLSSLHVPRPAVIKTRSSSAAPPRPSGRSGKTHPVPTPSSGHSRPRTRGTQSVSEQFRRTDGVTSLSTRPTVRATPQNPKAAAKRQPVVVSFALNGMAKKRNACKRKPGANSLHRVETMMAAPPPLPGPSDEAKYGFGLLSDDDFSKFTRVGAHLRHPKHTINPEPRPVRSVGFDGLWGATLSAMAAAAVHMDMRMATPPPPPPPEDEQFYGSATQCPTSGERRTHAPPCPPERQKLRSKRRAESVQWREQGTPGIVVQEPSGHSCLILSEKDGMRLAAPESTRRSSISVQARRSQKNLAGQPETRPKHRQGQKLFSRAGLR